MPQGNTQIGASLVEMSLLIALIALIGFASVSQLGKNVECTFLVVRAETRSTTGMNIAQAARCCEGPIVCTAGGCMCQ